jgi:hypothetical protein
MNYLTTLHQLHSTKTGEWTDGGTSCSVLRYYSDMLRAAGIITKKKKNL